MIAYDTRQPLNLCFGLTEAEYLAEPGLHDAAYAELVRIHTEQRREAAERARRRPAKRRVKARR